MFTADLSNVGNYIGAVQGVLSAIESPRTKNNFLGHIMDKTRNTFYIESQAAMSAGSARLKHVYEWGNEAGEPSNIRLFNLTKRGRGENRFMSYHFLPSTRFVPLPDVALNGKRMRRHVFTMKALVMETRGSVSIFPVDAKMLFIPTPGGDKEFTFGKSAVINPGGAEATGGFAEWWSLWWESRGQIVVNEETRKAEQTIKNTGQKVIRYTAGTRLNGTAVGGRFAAGKKTSFGYIDAVKQNAEMKARAAFRREWSEEGITE